MDAHQLAQARSEELDRVLSPARAPRPIDTDLAFRDLFLRYIECCVEVRKSTVIWLPAGTYDLARRRGLFGTVRTCYPDVKLHRKAEIHPPTVCVHE